MANHVIVANTSLHIDLNYRTVLVMARLCIVKMSLPYSEAVKQVYMTVVQLLVNLPFFGLTFFDHVETCPTLNSDKLCI